MAITAYDLKQATLEEAFHGESLYYNFKGGKELGVLTCLTKLQLLNVSFNSLNNLEGIQQLQMLRSLNISHNQVTSLQPITALSGLTTLNAGCNKIQDTSALEGLPVLRVLALHKNDIRKPSAMLLLTTLTSLEYLTLTGNPVCKQEDWQQATTAALPRLQVLDSLAVSTDNKFAQPDASIWRKAVEAGDLVHSIAGGRGSSAGLAGGGVGSNGSLAGSKQTSHAGRLAAPAATVSGTGAAGKTAPAAGVKDAVAMLPSISVPNMKHSTLVRQQDQQQPNNPYGWSRSGPVTVVHRQWYGGSKSGPAAMDVRSDGSAAVQWPDGSMAATLDTDTGMNAAYRLLAMYRSVVGVAASFDSNGGFVQYPNGSIMLVWNKKDGIGTCYAPDGTITHSFNSRKKPVGLKQDVRQQLDQYYSIVFKAVTYELQLLLSCDGCEIGLSLLHGAMLSRDAPAGKGATTAAAPQSGKAADAGAADDMPAMLARARALMAADFGIAPMAEPTDTGSADSHAAAEAVVMSDTAAAAAAAAAAPEKAEDEMQVMLARARALMAADIGVPAPMGSVAGPSDGKKSEIGPVAGAAVQAAGSASQALNDAAGGVNTDEDDGTQALLARARALVAGSQ